MRIELDFSAAMMDEKSLPTARLEALRAFTLQVVPKMGYS